jgi:hypothetical protein
MMMGHRTEICPLEFGCKIFILLGTERLFWKSADFLRQAREDKKLELHARQHTDMTMGPARGSDGKGRRATGPNGSRQCPVMFLVLSSLGSERQRHVVHVCLSRDMSEVNTGS